MANYKVIDADGHVRESIAGHARIFASRAGSAAIYFPNDEWDRDLRGKLGAKPEGPEDQLAAMDQDGIDVMVLYPTAGLHVGSLHERDFATAVTRPTTTGSIIFAKPIRRGLKFVALLAPQDPQAAAEELARAVTRARRGGRRVADLYAADAGLRRCFLRSDLRRRRDGSAWASVFTPALPPIRSAASAFANFFRPTPSTIPPSR